MNISGQMAGLCWGILLMIRQHSRPLLRTECTWKYVPSKENPADDGSRGMNFQKFVNVDRVLGSKILVKATVIMGDKFSCGIIATRRSRIEETSENKQDCC